MASGAWHLFVGASAALAVRLVSSFCHLCGGASRVCGSFGILATGARNLYGGALRLDLLASGARNLLGETFRAVGMVDTRCP